MEDEELAMQALPVTKPTDPTVAGKIYLTYTDVIDIFGISRAQLFKLIARGDFPKPLPIAKQHRMFFAGDLIEWQEKINPNRTSGE